MLSFSNVFARGPHGLVVCKGTTTIQPKKLFRDTGLDGIWQLGACGRIWRASIATSIDGTLTGLGGNLIIIDDPLKLGDAMSESVRARVIEWYRSTLLRPPPHLARHLLFRTLAYRLQSDRLGDLDGASRRLLDQSDSPEKARQNAVTLVRRIADIRPGTSLSREWNGCMQRVAVLRGGLARQAAADNRRTDQRQ